MLGNGVDQAGALAGYVTVKDAAEQLQVSTQRIYQLLREGSLSGIKVGSVRLVKQQTIEARIAWLEKEGY